MRPTKLQVDRFIRDSFYRNYEILKLEGGGHALAPQSRQYAIQQVMLYYEKLQNIAETVTDTEVKLTLPEQRTPNGHKFTIEGIVDIVRESNSTTMYDIKTHNADDVRAIIDDYAKQLNVYAYIWQQLRGQDLDETCVIATQVPRAIREAYTANDMDNVIDEMMQWKPVVPIEFSQENVEATIQEFAKVVDNIQDGVFEPASVQELSGKMPNSRKRFVTAICGNCDARFSCQSYRDYQMQKGGSTYNNLLKAIQDLGTTKDRQVWTSMNVTDERNPLPEQVEDLL
jgi:hypothetical protein